MEITASHKALVGDLTVRRALPRARRRTIGAWCFADHMGPVTVTAERGLDVGPHPHMGLHTATWLLEGEALHRDSLGTEQLLKAGQLNLMTAGHGISHAEEATGSYSGPIHGIQLWIAQPAETRNGTPAFEHHADLPRADLAGAEAVVFVGTLGDATSPARKDTPLVGAQLTVRRATGLPLDPSFEHGIVVLDGAITVDGTDLLPGHLGYLAPGHHSVEISGEARAILLGGEPFPERIQMWWNFVGRTRDEFLDAHRSWTDDDGRFGTVRSALPRIEARPPQPAP